MQRPPPQGLAPFQLPYGANSACSVTKFHAWPKPSLRPLLPQPPFQVVHILHCFLNCAAVTFIFPLTSNAESPKLLLAISPPGRHRVATVQACLAHWCPQTARVIVCHTSWSLRYLHRLHLIHGSSEFPAAPLHMPDLIASSAYLQSVWTIPPGVFITPTRFAKRRLGALSPYMARLHAIPA